VFVIFSAGSIVGANAWVTHCNRDIFGQDSTEFNPDHWLDVDAASYMDKYMLVFGGGSRTCIRRNFAKAAISKHVPEVLRLFEIELADPKDELKFDNHWYQKI
jgi:cytochrome P450